MSAQPAMRASRRITFFALAAFLSGVVWVLFAGVLALSAAAWTRPGYTATTPVGDLGFFALGAIIAGVGLALQLRSPERRLPALQQSLVGLAALTLAGLLGGRIEPLVGGALLLAGVAVLAVLHPARERFFRSSGQASAPLAAMAALALLPAAVYAADMLSRARRAGPSCFLGQCAYGDRLAELGALGIAIALVAVFAAVRRSRVSAWSAGLSAIILGVTSLLVPQAPGAVGLLWAGLVTAWGAAFIALAETSSGGP